MPERSMNFTFNHALCAAALLAVAGSPAAAADLSVFTTGAPSAVLKVLAVAFARDTGNRVEFTVGTPGDLQNKLAAGGGAPLVGGAGAGIRKMGKGGRQKDGRRGGPGGGGGGGGGGRGGAQA